MEGLYLKKKNGNTVKFRRQTRRTEGVHTDFSTITNLNCIKKKLMCIHVKQK